MFVILAFRAYGSPLLAVAGPVGALVTIALLLLAVGRLTAGVVRAARDAAVAGAPLWRRVTGAAVLSCAVAAVLTGPKFPLSVSTIYQTVGTEVVVAVPGSSSIGVGTEVQLRRAGVVLHPVTAHGQVCGAERTEQVDRHAGSAIVWSSGSSVDSVRRRVVPVCVAGAGSSGLGRSDPEGLAVLRNGSVSFGAWLRFTFFEPARAHLR